MEISSRDVRPQQIRQLAILEQLTRVATATDSEYRAQGSNALRTMLASEADLLRWLKAAIIRGVATGPRIEASETNARPGFRDESITATEIVRRVSTVLRLAVKSLKLALADDRQRLAWLARSSDSIERELAEWQTQASTGSLTATGKTATPPEWLLAIWLWRRPGESARPELRAPARRGGKRRRDGTPGDSESPQHAIETVLEDVIDWLRQSESKIDYCELAGVQISPNNTSLGKIISDIS